MSKLAIAIGISGSGKSTLFFNHFKNRGYAKICPDDIRAQLTGSISDQSINNDVWKISYDMLPMLLASNNVYFDATNLSVKTLKEICNNALISRFIESIDFIIFEDSLNWELCQERCKKDIANGINRSDTGNVVMENGDSLHFVMYNKFINLINTNMKVFLNEYNPIFNERKISINVLKLDKNGFLNKSDIFQ